MSNDEIKELIQLVVESGIAELELQRGEDRVRIRRTLETAIASAPGTVVESRSARGRAHARTNHERLHPEISDRRNILRIP